MTFIKQKNCTKRADHKKAPVYDAPKWVTFKGENKGKGRKVLLDDETGTILGGNLPKSFQGIKLKKKSERTRTEPNPFKQAMGKAANGTKGTTPAPEAQPNAATGAGANTARAQVEISQRDNLIKELQAKLDALEKKANPERKVQVDTSLPDKIPNDVILQNRDRSNVASFDQVRSIAKNLDYYKVGTSNDFNSGCPVVSYGSFDDKAMGKKTILSTPKGKRLSVQYAIVEANAVTTSNEYGGQVNDRYSSNDPSFTRAIAGNGRMMGISGSYDHFPDKAAAYKQDLIDNANEHGCDPELIKSMKSPVLVRVMQPKDVTADIGDQTNITQGLTLNAVEQSRNDVNRLKSLKFNTYEDGTPTEESVAAFIRSLPRNEQAGMLTSEGEPTRTAQDRLQNAIMMKGFNNDVLIKIRGQAIDPKGKTVIAALSGAAQAFANLEGTGDYDIRNKIEPLIMNFVTHKKNNSGKDFLYSGDLMTDERTNKMLGAIGRMIAIHKQSSKNVSTILRTVATDLKKNAEKYEHSRHNSSLFGGTMFTDNVPDPYESVKISLAKVEKAFKSKEAAKILAKEYGGQSSFNFDSALAADSLLNTYEKRQAFLQGYAFMSGQIMGTLYMSLGLSKNDYLELMEGLND